MVFRNLIFNAKIIEQRFGTGVLSHHNPEASVYGDEEEHRQTLAQIDVAATLQFAFTKGFSTATEIITSYVILR